MRKKCASRSSNPSALEASRAGTKKPPRGRLFYFDRKAGLVALALHALAQQLAVAAHRLGAFAGAALGGLLVIATGLHLRKTPSRCIFFLSTRSAWSTLLSRTRTCTSALLHETREGPTRPNPGQGRDEGRLNITTLGNCEAGLRQPAFRGGGPAASPRFPRRCGRAGTPDKARPRCARRG